MTKWLLLPLLLLLAAIPARAQNAGTCVNPGCASVPAQVGTLSSDWTIVTRRGEIQQQENECNIPQMVSVSGGLLHIITMVQTWSCGDFNTNGSVRTSPSTQPYISGDIQWASKSFLRGTVTIRAKMPPQSSAVWPSFWFLGTNCQTTNKFTGDSNVGTCPAFEAAGYNEWDMGEFVPHGNSGNGNWPWMLTEVPGQTGTCRPSQAPIDNNFHTYVAVWAVNSITMTIDGNPIGCSLTGSLVPTSPLFMLIQTQTAPASFNGGDYGPPVNAQLPVEFQVDSVKVVDENSIVIMDETFSDPTPPVVDFTDLVSGPATGGENNNGTILTIFGRGFGATRGTSTVTVGNQPVAAYLQWGDKSKAASAPAQLETISVALGSAAATGTVVVHTTNGTSICEDTKDNCQFTVRAGNIFCVSTAGNDGNSGAFPSSCWRTIPKAKNSMSAGDISYVQNGVAQTTIDDFGADLSIASGGSAANPIALVAYPGATASVGTPATAMAIRTPAISGAKDFWVLAGLNISAGTGLDLVGVDGWRVINNDFNCPNGAGQTACMHTDTTTNYRFYGNYTHNVGSSSSPIDKFYHGNYFTTNTNHVWMAWNEVNNNPAGVTTAGGCRGVQFFSTGGSDQFDLHVHDNYIHNTICDGLNFSTINADNGVVEAYNNVIFHVGTGPDPANGQSNYSCIVAGGGGTTPVLLYNNSLYDCGGRKAQDSGAITVFRPINMVNNITQQLTGELFLTSSSVPSSLSGTVNIWSGVAGAPSQTSGNITAIPNYTSPSTGDLTIPSTSNANGTGSNTRKSVWDFAGLVRPTPPSIGAYEFQAGTTPVNPVQTIVTGQGTVSGTGSITVQ